MIKIYLILILLILNTGCATNSLPSSFSVLTEEGITKNISLEELDSRARKYIAVDWGKPLDEIIKWKLVNALYRNEYSAIQLTYSRKIVAPDVIVLFNKQGFPYKIMGGK